MSSDLAHCPSRVDEAGGDKKKPDARGWPHSDARLRGRYAAFAAIYRHAMYDNYA